FAGCHRLRNADRQIAVRPPRHDAAAAQGPAAVALPQCARRAPGPAAVDGPGAAEGHGTEPARTLPGAVGIPAGPVRAQRRHAAAARGRAADRTQPGDVLARAVGAAADRRAGAVGAVDAPLSGSAKSAKKTSRSFRRGTLPPCAYPYLASLCRTQIGAAPEQCKSFASPPGKKARESV